MTNRTTPPSPDERGAPDRPGNPAAGHGPRPQSQPVPDRVTRPIHSPSDRPFPGRVTR